jgi:antitoxin component YwqK of YwqJK toxin-antitoxin module
MNYNNRKFRPKSNSSNGAVSGDMIFHYHQTGTILSCSYTGEKILKGHLIGVVDEDGCIEMRYHQVNANGELMTGICSSKPEHLRDGKVRLHEEWQWTSGDCSAGSSILEEI